MNCGCASICRCFCLFRANLSARAHRPWSGDVGAATLAAELAAAAGGADFIRTHEPRPLRDGLAVLAALKETARIR